MIPPILLDPAKRSKKCSIHGSHGGDYVDFFQKMARPQNTSQRISSACQNPTPSAWHTLYQKDVEERRGSVYIDDDLSADSSLTCPTGSNTHPRRRLHRLPHDRAEGLHLQRRNQRTRPQEGPRIESRRCSQSPSAASTSRYGQLSIRFFADTRKAMDKYYNHLVGTGWMINLHADPSRRRQRAHEPMGAGRSSSARGDIIRRVAFVKGDPAVRPQTKPISPAAAAPNKPAEPDRTGFLTLNGRPLYFLKLLNNYHAQHHRTFRLLLPQ